MSGRPVDTREVPGGYELVAVPDPAWRLMTGRRCRRSFGRGKPACGKPSIAELDRNADYSGNHPPSWWAYCPDHLYGRWVEDGQIMHWILRKKESGDEHKN